MIKGLETKTCGEILKEPNIFILEIRRLGRVVMWKIEQVSFLQLKSTEIEIMV